MPRTAIVDKNLVEEARANIERVSIIAVVVSKYSHLDPLPGVLKDLKLIRDIFVNSQSQGVYSPRQLKEMVNPTTSQVREAIVEYSYSRSAPGDILILYFSGHGCVIGANTFGLCLSDTKVSNKGTVLPLSALSFRDIIHTLSAADVTPIFIVDACFSGATATNYFPGLDAALQEQIQSEMSGAYGLLCSSSRDSLSFSSSNGSPFTVALHEIIARGLQDRQRRHFPFLTIRDIAKPLRELIERTAAPLPRCYPGPDLPEIPIAKNAGFKPQAIKFSYYMRRVVEFIWNDGHPREVSIHDLDEAIGKSSYGNHSKLGYLPWKLLEDGTSNRTRRLTAKGKSFAKGETRIPEVIIKDPITWLWVADSQARHILITEVLPSRKESKKINRERSQRSTRSRQGRQLRLPRG